MSSESISSLESKENTTIARPIPWSEIEPGLEILGAVEGGYTNSKRGITIIKGKKVFIKIGVDEFTKGWAHKEIGVYDFLRSSGYTYIPKILSTSPDKTAFALEALLAENGWDWSDTWSDERLRATLLATDDLASIKPDSKYIDLLKPVITDDDNGWIKLAASPELQENLRAKLNGIQEVDVLTAIDRHLHRSMEFKVRHDSIVHDDIRADNCPWNQSLGQVKLVDLNWVELGDRRIDQAAMLVHVQNSGFGVVPNFKDRLDPEALHWIAGYWLKSASTPIWKDGPEKLREVQLKSGLTALKLSNLIQK